MQQEPRILRHPLASRIFHWSLILGFLPAALSGFVIWWKPEGEDFVNLAMRIHIIGATIFTVASILFTILATDRVVAFIRHISEWTMHDVRWLMVGGGYMHKIVFKKIRESGSGQENRPRCRNQWKRVCMCILTGHTYGRGEENRVLYIPSSCICK